MSSRQLQLRVLAPLSGRVVPIEDVPDPAFAQKMVGDGLSIDPATDVVLAPIDGRVIDFHDARHAIVIADASGVEIMVHVGLDTVMLAGQGSRRWSARAIPSAPGSRCCASMRRWWRRRRPRSRRSSSSMANGCGRWTRLRAASRPAGACC